MSKMRALIERYEKWMMIFLVVFLMIIFTATGAISDWLMGNDQPVAGADDVIGSFYVVPDTQVEITNARYAQALRALRVWNVVTRGSGREDVSVLDVWSQLILVEAARQQGIYVSDRDLVATMRSRNRGLDALMNDRERYTGWVRTNFNINLKQFEESFREALTAQRVRELYRDSITIAPPATREALVRRYAPGTFEYVSVSWAALDAADYLETVEKEFNAVEDQDKLLKEFFETDPSVKGDTTKFRHNRRFEFELLYTIHSRLNEANLKQLEGMFFKAWPEYAPDQNDGKDILSTWPKGDDKAYWDSYGERLLEAEGRSADEMREKATQEIDALERKEAEDEKEKEEDGEQTGDDESGESDDSGEDEDSGKDEDAGKSMDDVALKAVRDARIKKAQYEMGLKLVKERIYRELRLRVLYRLMHNDVHAHPERSLEKIYDRLAAFDSKDNPLLSKTPGEGLVVFRRFDKPLSRTEIEELKDAEVTFGPNVAYRVSIAARDKLPAVRPTADVLGDLCHGRMSLRVTGLERERRKTFDELSDGEKIDLKEQYYLPYQARERAGKVLGELKKACDEGKVKPDGFGEAAAATGARVYEDEQITASSRFLADPDSKLLFPAEFQRMRDRHFLRSHLASLLASDRIKKEDERIKPGSWLEIEVRSDSEDEETDPGTAYLILLIDRTKPTAATMPDENLTRAKSTAMRQGLGRDVERWTGRYQQLFNDFSVTFNGTMKTQVESAFERIADAERDRANAALRGS